MYKIHLDLIDDNPWQPRQEMGDVIELAHDILSRRESRPETLGLLHRPAVRIVGGAGEAVKHYSLPDGEDLTQWLEGQGYRAQVAYGHRRKQAFESLQPDEEGFGWLPVEVVVLNDEEMATTAWSENSARKNLIAVEEARFIKRLVEEFGWTHEEVGEQLGMARPTVSNRLRLLKLPEKIQEAQMRGEMPERKASALVPLMDLPDKVINKIKKPENEWNTSMGELVEMALDQEVISDRLRFAVDEAIEEAGNDLDDANFPLDHEFDGRGVKAKVCLECAVIFQHDGQNMCPDDVCLERKNERWRAHEIDKAVEELGIPLLVVPEGESKPDLLRQNFWSPNTIERKAVGVAVEKPCDRLRLFHSRYTSSVAIKEHPHIEFGCLKDGKKRCACLAAAKRAEKKRLEESGIDPRSEWEIEREQREQAYAIITEKVLKPAAEALLPILLKDDSLTWEFMTEMIESRRSMKKVIEKPKAPAEYLHNLVFTELDNILPWNAKGDVEKARKAVVKKLKDNFKLKVPALEGKIVDEGEE